MLYVIYKRRMRKITIFSVLFTLFSYFLYIYGYVYLKPEKNVFSAKTQTLAIFYIAGRIPACNTDGSYICTDLGESNLIRDSK